MKEISSMSKNWLSVAFHEICPKGNFLDNFLVTRHDPVRIAFVPLSCYFSMVC